MANMRLFSTWLCLAAAVAAASFHYSNVTLSTSAPPVTTPAASMTPLIPKRSSAAGTKVGELPDEPKPDDPEPDDPKPLEPQPTLTSAPYTGTSTSTGTSTIKVSLSSATASSAPLIPYVVITEELTRAAGTALQDRMKPYVMGPIDANLREDEQGTQTMVFRFNTMATLAKELELLHDTDIAWIFPESDVGYDEDEPSTPDRATSPPLGPGPELASQDVFYDPGADASLKALSQPADYASYDPNDMYGYAYPTSSGKGITIYIIDTGANPTHEEYTGSPGLKRWMYVAKNTFQSDSDTKRGHGSCVQSLVNGPRFGAAKGADIVIVKLPVPFTTSDIIMALYWVTDDIAKRSLEGKAVVTMSVYTVGVDIAKSKAFGIQVLKDGWDATAESMRDQMELLIYLDVPVVVASGNDRQEYEHIDGFPAAFAKELDIIAVGAMKSNGARASYSQGDINEVTVLAMGEVECARTDSTWETRHTFGTSFAAPRVAGMIATWLSSEKYRERLQVKGKVAANVKNLLKELAYVKMPASEVDGGFPVAYNGFSKFTCSGDSKSKRDAARGFCQHDDLSPTSTSLPSITPTGFSTVITTATPVPTSLGPIPEPTGTSVYMVKGSTDGKSTECFPGIFDMRGRTNFVYKFTLDSTEASVVFRRSFLPGPSLFEGSGLSGIGHFTMSSEDQPFYTCLTNNGDKEANLQVNIY